MHATADPGYAGHVKTGSRRALVLDITFGAALMALGAVVTNGSGPIGAGTALDTVLIPAVILPLFLRRRWPFGAAVALAAGCVVSGIPTFDQFRIGVAIPVAMVVVFALARRTDRARALTGLALVLAGMVFIGATDVALTDEGGVAGMVAFSFPLCIGTWVGGRVVRSRARVAEELAERSRMLERRREQTAQLAVEVERTRLASELDASTRARVREIITLAELGERRVAEQPELALEIFSELEQKGRASLNEMRGLLGVLRSDERARRAPRPTLAQLEGLLSEARRGGRLVELDVQGERRSLPGGVELAAYRTLQHALVAVRGAGEEPVAVHLRYGPNALDLEVRGLPVDDRGGQIAVMAARERVTAHGGSFRTDTSKAGRRVLRARLPLVPAHV